MSQIIVFDDMGIGAEQFFGVWWRRLPASLLSPQGQILLESDKCLTMQTTINKLRKTEEKTAYNYLAGLTLEEYGKYDPNYVAIDLLKSCIADYPQGVYADIVARYSEMRFQPFILCYDAINRYLLRHGRISYMYLDDRGKPVQNEWIPGSNAFIENEDEKYPPISYKNGNRIDVDTGDGDRVMPPW